MLQLIATAAHKELKWHLAQLLPRLTLNKAEQQQIWSQLSGWAVNPSESRIVRVNALQALLELTQKNSAFKPDFLGILAKTEHENIPSLTARIKKLKLQTAKNDL